MCRYIAAVTEKKHFLVFRVAADRAGLEIGDIIIYIFDDHGRIDIRHLHTVFNGVGGYHWAYT
jgi:hypothetical protein